MPVRRRAPRKHENARSALECGSEAAALEPGPKAVAAATALQGAFGTTIFKEVRGIFQTKETLEGILG
jgi:hypothetical protein